MEKAGRVERLEKYNNAKNGSPPGQPLWPGEGVACREGSALAEKVVKEGKSERQDSHRGGKAAVHEGGRRHLTVTETTSLI